MALPVLSIGLRTGPAAGGTPVEIEEGGHAVLPKGFSGTWEMVGETYRELVVMEYKTWLADVNAS